MKKTDVTFVTCDKLPNLDPDDLLALTLLQERGWQCRGAIWNDPSVNWSDAGLIVIRSTWDYHLQPMKFLRWAQWQRENLLNSIDIISWNLNKRYLVELQERGISVIPTVLITSPSQSLADIVSTRGWNDIILKPAFGLSTYGVKRVALDSGLDEAEAHVRELLKAGEVLVQPFMPAVSEYGERALSFVDGVYSHCIRKVPFQKFGAAGHAGEAAFRATEEEIAFAIGVLGTLPEVPLYARVDLVPNENQQPMLMELELVEPSLFLSFDSAAPKLFADAIERRLKQRAAGNESMAPMAVQPGAAVVSTGNKQ